MLTTFVMEGPANIVISFVSVLLCNLVIYMHCDLNYVG